jgi:hypothetical protein
MRVLRLVVVLVTFVMGFSVSFTIADPPKVCTGSSPGCVGLEKCLTPYGQYSCAEFEEIAYNTCNLGNGTCPEEQVECAKISYFAGADACENGKCNFQGQPRGTDKAKTTGCKKNP